MGKIEDYKIGKKTLKIVKRLPYRLECILEGLLAEYFEMINENERKLILTKKIKIHDFLLTGAIIEPKITTADLDDDEHELNEKFRDIGNDLFEKYVGQYADKISVKKKPSKSPD